MVGATLKAGGREVAKGLGSASASVLETLREWTLASNDRVPPKSLAETTIRYLDSQWPKLERVLEDERPPLDLFAIRSPNAKISTAAP